MNGSVADLVEERERASVAFERLAGELAQRRLGFALHRRLDPQRGQRGHVQPYESNIRLYLARYVGLAEAGGSSGTTRASPSAVTTSSPSVPPSRLKAISGWSSMFALRGARVIE